jgi:hypothetical protein
MKNIKSMGLIAVAALSFVFMSFSSSDSDELYGDSYAIQYESSSNLELEDAAWLAAAGRLVVGASRVVVNAAVRTCPQVEAVIVQASTLIIFASSEEKHSNEYNRNIVILKNQQTRQLG